MSVAELTATGERLSYAGEALRDWVVAEQAAARAEREAQRQEEQVQRQEAQAQREAEKHIWELRLKMVEIERGTQETSSVTVGAGEGGALLPHSWPESAVPQQGPHKMILVFDGAKDNLGAYFKRFDQVMEGESWPRERWALTLSMCIVFEALGVYGRLSPEDSKDYEKVKGTLLRHFRYTADGYREKFREGRAEEGETIRQFVARIEKYFDKWVEMSNTPKMYLGIREQVVGEQCFRNCHPKWETFLRERNSKDLASVVENYEHYVDAQRQTCLSRFRNIMGAPPAEEELGSHQSK